MRKLLIICVVGLMLAAGGAVQATLTPVYSQLPSGTGMAMSDFGPSPQWGFGGTFYQVSADDFTLAEDTLVTHVRWWGVYAKSNEASPPDSDFTVRIFAGSGNIPGAKIFDSGKIGGAGRTLAGRHISNSWGEFDEYKYLYQLPTPFSAQAGTKYWLAVIDDTPESSGFQYDSDFVWTKSGSGAFACRYYGYYGGGHHGWTSVPPTDMAFELLVPEPATIALLGLGALGLVRRKRS